MKNIKYDECTIINIGVYNAWGHMMTPIRKEILPLKWTPIDDWSDIKWI
ncbi:MAG: hypothetical protein A4E48_00601 [Methanosaeta sp. PtaU1.Bin060]|nr:MAG: hypothetical protein A4E48_00601 [Methanosaeta sp. PtaU1.Bin060]